MERTADLVRRAATSTDVVAFDPAGLGALVRITASAADVPPPVRAGQTVTSEPEWAETLVEVREPDWLPPGPRVHADGSVTFVVADDDEHITDLWLWFHLREFGAERQFERRRHGSSVRWVLTIPAPPVARMEYLLTVTANGEGTRMILDPANDRIVDSVFGPHSVVEFATYRRPDWLDGTAPDGRLDDIALPPAAAFPESIPGLLWSPAGTRPSDPMPLLVANDGPEYLRFSLLHRYAADHIARGDLPPFRMALLHPTHRDLWYSGSPGYARTIARTGLPWLREQVHIVGPVVGMGASLGGFSAFATEWLFEGTFGGLFLQSSSFFDLRFDAHESRYPYFWRIIDTVRDVTAGEAKSRRRVVPRVVMTCGTGEENLSNNRTVARHLRRQGYDVQLVENPDGHNFTGWRDAFDPALTTLLRDLWTT